MTETSHAHARRRKEEAALDIDAQHLPEDAGVHSDGLRAILERIPTGWGRWIGVSAGWYRLVVTLNQELAEIDPWYEIYQVKEKFGTLRYYCSSSDERSRRLIRTAEMESATICETCGEFGRLGRSAGRVTAACSAHGGVDFVAMATG